MTFDPFKNLVLDEYEQEIEDAIDENLVAKSLLTPKRRKELEEAAKRHVELRKTKRISLRVKNMDLIKIKLRAEKMSVPYQTMLNSLIHRYAEGEVKLEM